MLLLSLFYTAPQKNFISKFLRKINFTVSTPLNQNSFPEHGYLRAKYLRTDSSVKSTAVQDGFVYALYVFIF